MCLPTNPDRIESSKLHMWQFLKELRDYRPSPELERVAKEYYETHDQSFRKFYKEHRDLLPNGWGTTEDIKLVAWITNKGTLQITDDQIKRVCNRLGALCTIGVRQRLNDMKKNSCISYLFLTARLCELEGVNWIYPDQWKEGNQIQWDQLCRYMSWNSKNIRTQ